MPAEVQAAKPSINLSRYELRVHGRRVKLERQPMDLLIFLVQRKDQLVSREDIVEKLWGKDVFVDVDGSINRAVRKIRAALEDDPANPSYLETVVGKGYRFIGEVELVEAITPSVQPQTNGKPRADNSLRRAVPILLAVSLLLVFTGALIRWQYRRSNSALPRIHSLAVLPLANLSGDPSQDYFADGMTDELITELARIDSLRVISRTSVMRYKNTKTLLPQIARELSVDAVVEGSVVRAGDKLRITAQLIESATDHHIWADSYERDFRDVLTLQREVALAIAAQVNANLTPGERSRLAGKSTVNSEAYENYLRGLFFWNKWTEDGVRKSIEYFQQAIQADPMYAPAYAGLANSYIAMGDFGVGVLAPHNANAAAEQAALKAISLDSALGDAHAALAMSRFRSDSNLNGVEEEFKRAITLSPGSVTPHHWYSHYLLAVGRSQEAIAEGQTAYDLSPIDPEMGTHMQFLYLFLHRYDEVIAQARKNLELDPNFGETYFMRAQAFEQEHMYVEAKRDFLRAIDLSGRRSMVLASLGHLLAISGDRRGAQQILAELNALSARRYVPAYEKGLVQVGLRDNEAALEDLRQAYKEGSHWMFILQTDARLDPLRSDPRFHDLVGRVAR